MARGTELNSSPSGTWRSLVAHLPWEQGVAGSNPAVPIWSWLDVLAGRGGSAPRRDPLEEAWVISEANAFGQYVSALPGHPPAVPAEDTG